MKEFKGFNTLPILPNLSQYARDMTEGGPVKAIIKRFFVLRAKNKFIFFISIISNPINVLKIVKKDFTMGIRVLTELELLKLTEISNIKKFAIGADLVDLALAYENKKIFKEIFFLARKYNKELIIFTDNYSQLKAFIKKMIGGHEYNHFSIVQNNTKVKYEK